MNKSRNIFICIQAVLRDLTRLAVLCGFSLQGEEILKVISPILIKISESKLILGIFDCIGREELLDYILKMLETSLEIMRIRQESNGVDEKSVLKHIIIIDLLGLTLQVLICILFSKFSNIYQICSILFQATSISSFVLMTKKIVNIYEGEHFH